MSITPVTELAYEAARAYAEHEHPRWNSVPLPPFTPHDVQPSWLTRGDEWEFYVLLEVYPNGSTHFLRVRIDDESGKLAARVSEGMCVQRPDRMSTAQQPVKPPIAPAPAAPSWPVLTQPGLSMSAQATTAPTSSGEEERH